MAQTFGEFIRNRRRDLRLTQRQITEALGLKSVAFLSDIEAGNRKPSHGLLPALARILQTDTETLKAHDIRSPLEEVRSLLAAHPEYTAAFRKVIEHTRDLGAEEILRRIELRPKTTKPADPLLALQDALPKKRRARPKATPPSPPPGPDSLPLD